MKTCMLQITNNISMQEMYNISKNIKISKKCIQILLVLTLLVVIKLNCKDSIFIAATTI